MLRVGLKHVLSLIIYMVACMTSLLANPREVLAPDFIEHILQLSKPEMTLNTVLSRLDQSSNLVRPNLPVTKKTNCEDSDELLLPEYIESIESWHEHDSRQLGPQKHYPICHLEKRVRTLNTENYEYRPSYYEEITCVPGPRKGKQYHNEICPSLGFSCVQWNRTIHLTRRAYTSECWEMKTLVIPAGCECMWPVHRLGDMAPHI